MRKNIAAGNWKMNLNHEEAIELANHIVASNKPNDVDVILAAPFVYLAELANLVKEVPKMNIAAQNCHQSEKGAYTGEVSVGMLQSIGLDWVILGHSERRAYFNEDNKVLKEKLDQVLSSGMKCIFCCGEPLEVRKGQSQNSYVQKQLEESLFHIDPLKMKDIVIAYEPIWAIGTGETATPEQAQEMHAFIRSLVSDKFGNSVSEDLSILYGGSVKPGNAIDLFSQNDVDGGLVGGASLKAEDFVKIINSF